MRSLCVLVLGEPPPRIRNARGGFGDLVRAVAQSAFPGPWVEVNVVQGGVPPHPSEVAGIIVSGSAASVTEPEPWMQPAQRYLLSAIENATPVLGICFGHQLLATALGGQVRKNPRGREIGTVPLELVGSDPLLGEDAFFANMTHVDSVMEPPAGAQLLARTALESCAALRFADTAWGVQFHPEIDREVMTEYIDTRATVLEAEGMDVTRLRSAARDTPAAGNVIRRLAELASQKL